MASYWVHRAIFRVNSTCFLNVDTESVYTEIATSMIERYSELEDPQHKQVDTHFKSKVMGSSKAVAMRMMIDTFQLRVSEEEYLEVNSHLEVSIFA